ncbi:MAG: transglutaminase-like domain-containing protein [Deltaproteobacteria bacterium]|nr:transglutaminase-like domain-containing protein [Deltaproteobacteria bacterium]
MSIFQNDRKIGYSHSRFAAENDGYRLQETVLMRINTMGMVQDIQLKTRARLKADFSLVDFDFEINSGRFSFNVSGSVTGDKLTIQTASVGSRRQTDIKLKTKPYLLTGITAALAAAELNPGDKYAFDVFDPGTLGQSRVIVDVIGKEDIQILGDKLSATKVSLNLKGTSQMAWISESGDVLQEKGILGIRLEKTSRDLAINGKGRMLEASTDLTRIASVASNVMLKDLERLATLKIEISGISFKKLGLDGGRQTLKDNVLTVKRESTDGLTAAISKNNFQILEKIYLKPTPFIQSDHQKIQDMAHKIAGNHAGPLDKVRALIDWVHQHIEKRPVLSLPDALSTLENRVGDCNEHAVLLAALARAAGIPCRIEAGLVYLKGRFYYHAWNLVYLGRWITVDALFGQIPADVSHIRMVTGSPRQQLDLLAVIGQVRLKIIK